MQHADNFVPPIMIACGHQHEVGFDITNIDATRAAVRACPMRKMGQNALCAHTDMFPDEGEDVFRRLLRRANESAPPEVGNIITFLKQVNQQLDNLKRASHIHGSFGRNEDILPISPLWHQTREYLIELNQILDRSIGNRRDLNLGERTRFDFVIFQTQKRSIEILRGLFPSIS